MSFTIRAYTAADERGVIALWNTVFPDAPAWNDPAADIERKLSVQRELFFVAVDDETIVGTAMAGFDGHRGWVYYVAVAPEQRRQGVGRALMRAVEAGLTGLGCTKLNLQVRATNPQAIAFYERLGFSVEERVSMGKRLV
jgi:ribosomal protein S18 acetylase RimI-like enzyme